MDIIALSKLAHERAKEKGFWENDNINEKILLIISEVGESVNAHRKGKRADLAQFNAVQANGDVTFSVAFESYVKDTFEDKIADCFIRACDLIGWLECQDIYKGFFYGKEALLDCIYMAVSAFFNEREMTLLKRISYFVGAMEKVAETEKFDLAKHVELKMRYNEGREYKHGCKY